MSETEQKHDTESATDAGLTPAEPAAEPFNAPEEAPRHARRGLAAMAMLVALGGLGGVYFLWSQLGQQETAARQERQRLATRIDELSAAQQQLGGRIDGAVAKLGEVAQQTETVTDALNQINDRLGRDRQDWVLAESDYLLQIADRRLELERDVAGAEAALTAADQRLGSLNDPSLNRVRAYINDELQALHEVPRIDIDGMTLELGSLSKAVDTLVLAGRPKDEQESEAEPEPVRSGWRAFLHSVWLDLKGLVTIRHQEAGAIPLITPDQRLLLRQNLRLKLETARLSLLRGHNQAYREALLEADEWVTRFYQSDSPATVAMHTALTRLAGVDIAPPLPDINDSLRALRQATQRAKEGTPRAKGGKPQS